MHTCLPQGTPPYTTSVNKGHTADQASLFSDQLQLTSNAVLLYSVHTLCY